MSDNEDAMSEKAPEGWISMFNKTAGSNAATGSSGGSTKGKSSKNEQQSGGWFGGFFGVAEKKSRESSISSDTPPIKDSDNESLENQDEDDRFKLVGDNKEDEENEGGDSDGSLHAYDVDSDGFPVSSGKPKGETDSVSNGSEPVEIDEDILKDYDSGAVAEVEELPEFSTKPVERSSPRRERIMNRMNFTVAHEAAELAVPDPVVEEPKPLNSEATTEPAASPNQASWWQAFIPVASAESETTQNVTIQDPIPESKPAVETVLEQPAPVTEIKPETTEQRGWGSWFGGKKEGSVSPRSILPQIRRPPDIAAVNELNTFFVPEPMSEPCIELLGPRPLARYEGRLRGWPRGLGRYWSTHEQFQPPRRAFSQNNELSGVSALAMFRVT
jgi:hypothetical protein